MKVLFVNPGGNSSGGAERSLRLLINGLVNRGHRLAVATLMEGDAADSFESAGARVLANGIGEGLARADRHGSSGGFLTGSVKSLPEAAAAVSRLRALAVSFEPDVIHTNGLRAHALSPLLAHGNHKLIWTLRERPPSELGRWLIRSAAHFAAAIIAPSNFATGLVSMSRRPVYVIPNPVERGVPLDRETCRRSLGLPLDRPIATVIAHLHPSKGHHVAVAAWEQLDPPRPLLVLAGGNLYGQASAEYGESLKLLIERKELGHDIKIVGLVREMASLYAASDLVVHPALHPEGFGRSIAEAQQAGVPVVATAHGGPLELIEDGVSGLLVAPGDAPGLAGTVARLLGDPALGRGLRAGGLQAAQRYGVASHVVAVESVYRAVCHRGLNL